jgi:hypothetical protein
VWHTLTTPCRKEANAGCPTHAARGLFEKALLAGILQLSKHRLRNDDVCI